MDEKKITITRKKFEVQKDILNSEKIIEEEAHKIKKIFVLNLALDYWFQNNVQKIGFHFLKNLKKNYDKLSLLKLAYEKIQKIFKKRELEATKEFMKNFLQKFATKKRLFEFNCFQNMQQTRFPIHKSELVISSSPEKKFKQVYKIYKDQIKENNFKHKLLKQHDLNYFFDKQNSVYAIFKNLLIARQRIYRTCFKNISKYALNTVSPEEMTGFKGFSKYSIVLLPFKGKANIIIIVKPF